jgi:transcriptional regulator of acetoin/glycerol metabolism
MAAVAGTETVDSAGVPRGARDKGDRLIVAFQCARPLAPPACYLLDGRDELVVGRGAAAADRKRRIEIADRTLSEAHLRLAREGATWRVEDLGSKNGTFVNGERTSRRELADGDVLEVGGTFLVARFGVARRAAIELDPRPAFRTLKPELSVELAALERAARASVPILLSGETGTGKEVLARELHAASARAGRPFVAVNCGALPPTLVESELFGARRGAFTGAEADRLGLVRSAHLGTLFLDEIAELPPPAQAALLRVLQEGEVPTLGDVRPARVDLRVIAATHQDLSALVDAGRFRADLHARLRGYRFRLPPLRERREDLGLLVAALLTRGEPSRAERLRFARAAGRALFLHGWPLNVRELELALRAACAVAEGDELTLAHLPAELADPDGRAAFVARVKLHRGNVSALARALGTSRSQVRRIAARHGVDLDAERDDGDP